MPDDPEHVDLTWTAAVGGGTVDGYYVYRDGTDVANRLATLGSSVRTYTDTTSTHGTIYTYYVLAYNDGGNGHSGRSTTPPPPSLLGRLAP